MRMMDAIVKPAAAPGLELRQVPVPTPGAGEVLIKVHKTAICGTDVHIYDWNEWSAQHVKPPMVIGHEYVGEIAELGAGVTGLTTSRITIKTTLPSASRTSRVAMRCVTDSSRGACHPRISPISDIKASQDTLAMFSRA